MKIVEDIKRVIVPYEQLVEGLNLARNLGYTELVVSVSRPYYPWEKTEIDLSKITEYRFLEFVGISDKVGFAQYPINLLFLSDLPNLKSIWLDLPGDCIIDFGKMKKLQKVNLSWSSQYSNFNSLSTLIELRIVGYNKSSLEDFRQMTELKKLILWDPTINSLMGIEGCISLNYMDLFRAKKLQSLKGIERLNKLEYLHILSCHKLLDISAVFELGNLRKLTIEKCKSIKEISLVEESSIEFLHLDSVDNLYFISKMPKLKYLHFENIENGDLSPLLSHPTLSDVDFPNKKKYTHTRLEIVNSLKNNSTLEIGASE